MGVGVFFSRKKLGWQKRKYKREEREREREREKDRRKEST